jgi:DHA1 family bicyclomycin/chloramphenicol resistance-like MFS transporter
MSAGAGIVISRAVIRDMFPPADAQAVMSQVTDLLRRRPADGARSSAASCFGHAGWHSIFWFLTGVGVVLFVAIWRLAARRRCTTPIASRSMRATCSPATGSSAATRAS